MSNLLNQLQEGAGQFSKMSSITEFI